MGNVWFPVSYYVVLLSSRMRSFSLTIHHCPHALSVLIITAQEFKCQSVVKITSFIYRGLNTLGVIVSYLYGGSLSGLMEEIRLSCVLRLHYHPKAYPGAEWGSDTGPRVQIVVVHFSPHDISGHTNRAPQIINTAIIL